MLSYRLVLYYDICVVSWEYCFYSRHFKRDFLLHYITLLDVCRRPFYFYAVFFFHSASKDHDYTERLA